MARLLGLVQTRAQTNAGVIIILLVGLMLYIVIKAGGGSKQGWGYGQTDVAPSSLSHKFLGICLDLETTPEKKSPGSSMNCDI